MLKTDMKKFKIITLPGHGMGPVDALNNAFWKALAMFFP